MNRLDGIGNNCRKEENETAMLCADKKGLITPAEPLIIRSPFTAHLCLPLQEPPEELYFKDDFCEFVMKRVD